MVLGISEDFTSNITLDSELKDIPSSGLFLNSGVHPSITVDNLLKFLPLNDVFPNLWVSDKDYKVFSESRNQTDIVSYKSRIYQSVKESVNQEPSNSSEYWLETNSESLILKSYIYKVEDKVYSDLRLNRRLVDNQYLYEVGDKTINLTGDYAAWVFEAKGSDYLTFRINEISIQKKSTTPIDLYVINQGVLVDTLQVIPKNGIISFDKIDYTFNGKGKWIFAIDSTDVEVGDGVLDPFKYKGFTVKTAIGIGENPESADYSYKTSGNGLGFNISVYLDSEKYIDNNISEFGNYIRSVFEYMTFQMFLHNPNKRINVAQSILMNENVLNGELKETKYDTVVSRYLLAKKESMEMLRKTFDKLIGFNSFKIKRGVL